MEQYDESAHDQVTNLARNHPDQALIIANELVEKFPLCHRAWSSLAYAQNAQQDYEGAITSCKRATELEPLEPSNHFNLGRLYIKIADHHQAVSAFSRSIQESTENEFHYYLDISYMMRAYCNCKIGKFAEAEHDLNLVQERGPVWIDKLRSKQELLEACKRRRLD